MPLAKELALRAAAAALSCLVCACGTEDEPRAQGGNAGTAGAGAGTGGSTAGAGGVSSGGAGAGNAGTGNGAGGAGGLGGAGGAAGGSGTAAGGSGGSAGGGTLTLTSPAFENVAGCSIESPAPCAVFPDENVSYMGRANVSPELRWTGVPAGTQSFAIVLVDATFGQAHWVLWNIPANASMLPANIPKDTAMPAIPAGSRQTNANFATDPGDGYFGPHMPCNVFQFELYALATSTFSPKQSETAALVWIELQELGDPVLGLAKLTGRSNDYMMTCE